MTPTFNDHTNDLGDWCPWSGQPADHVAQQLDFCPARCRASCVEEDE